MVPLYNCTPIEHMACTTIWLYCTEQDVQNIQISHLWNDFNMHFILLYLYCNPSCKENATFFLHGAQIWREKKSPGIRLQ